MFLFEICQFCLSSVLCIKHINSTGPPPALRYTPNGLGVLPHSQQNGLQLNTDRRTGLSNKVGKVGACPVKILQANTDQLHGVEDKLMITKRSFWLQKVENSNNKIVVLTKYQLQIQGFP